MKGTSPFRASRVLRRTATECHDGVADLINSLEKGKSMAIVFVGIDLAKRVFVVHGVDEHGKPALARPRVARPSWPS